MTIYRFRTVDLAPAKASAARDVMVRAAAYLTAQYPEVRVEILRAVDGPPHQLHMVTRCASMGALDAYEAARLDDAGWLALIEEYRALDAQRSTSDHFYELEE